MTQEQKELLLQDLCARLPYGVKGNFQNSDDKLLRSITIMHRYLEPNGMVMTGDIKPYLFPISSMTEEQKRNLISLFNCHVEITQYEIKFADYRDSNMDNWNKVFHWCYKNHFDINGLIPMGLAIDATGKNIY